MTVAILVPHKTASDVETFIQNHIDNLPYEVVVVYGDKFPFLTDTMQPSLGLRRWFKYKNIVKRILKLKVTTVKEYYLERILKSYAVDAVFAEYLITAAEVQDVCKQNNIPLITIALGYEISQYNVLKQYEAKYRSLFQYASSVLVVSNHMRANLLQFDCPEQHIVYTPASPSEAFFELSPKFEQKQILAVGRFVEKKAPQHTIVAFSKVLKQHADSILVMGGDGPLLKVCKDLVAELGIADHVVFKGRITIEEHKALLQESCMFVQHSVIASHGDSEGTPVAILEASASGLPVVSTLHAGIPDVVLQGETGFLVAEHDVDVMADKMVALLNDLTLAKQMGSKGKNFVKENFTLEQHIDTIAKCIDNVNKKSSY